MTESIFAVNLTEHAVSLKAGYIIIPKLGHKKIFKTEQEHPDFKDAEYRGWIRYSTTEPTGSVVPEIVYANNDPEDNGMTPEEMLSFLDKNKDAPKPELAKSEALGKDDRVFGEAKSTRIGAEDSEITINSLDDVKVPEVSEVADKKATRSKKVAE